MLNLNYRDSKPIYEQVKDDIRKLVISNAFLANEKLPSVRELASKNAINPNTIARAYKELEDEGYLYPLSGKGTFVSAEIKGKNKDKRVEELIVDFDEVVKELLFLKIPGKNLSDRITQIDERGKNNDSGQSCS